jgi:hypothetical protein
MNRPLDDQNELRRSALTAFLEERIREGYLVETRTDTHAIIAPAPRRPSFRGLLRKPNALERQVLEVDSDGVVTMRPAEPLRS